MSIESTVPPALPFFIGIDSDGTVFDSMEIKHKRVFQPVATELWGLQCVEERFCSIAEEINLYSVLRGINRFEGLALAFERLSDQSEAGRQRVAGFCDLQAFLRSGSALSFAALAEYNASKQSTFLDKVLEWSRRADALYAKIMEGEGNAPYPRVYETLKRASRRAEIVVVSSSSRETLEQDWGDAGLLSFVTRIEGQEQGSKTTQLNSAITQNRPASHALMMGDAMGDLNAAKAHGMLFFPITPGAEQQCWQQFEAEGLDRFLTGSYAGAYEQELLAGFENALRAEDTRAVSQ